MKVYWVLICCILSFSSSAAAQGGDAEKTPAPVRPPTTTTPRNPAPTSKPPKPVPVKPSRPATTATLVINSNVPGSAVTVNGKATGGTDGNGYRALPSMKPGKYTITLAKPGYRDNSKTISLAAGQDQSLYFELSLLPGTVTISTNVADAEIAITNVGNYSGRVDELSLSPGYYNLSAQKKGYKPTTRGFEVRSGEPTKLELTLLPISVNEVLTDARRAFESRDFRRTFVLSSEVLSIEPHNAEANLLIGYSYYNQGIYDRSLEPIAKALSHGAQARFNIRHRHEVFLAGEDLCLGTLTLGNGRITFASQTKAGHDFTVPLANVYELKTADLGGGRLIVKVRIPKKSGKGEDKKTYDFYVGRAGTKDMREPGAKYPMMVIYCHDCQQEISALYQLITTAKVTPIAVADEGPIEGRPTLRRRDPTPSPSSTDMTFVDSDEAGKRYRKAQSKTRANDAIEELRAAIKLRPDFSMAHYDLGLWLMSQQKWSEALVEFQAALLGDSRPSWIRVWAHIKSGNIYDATGDRNKAVREYNAALQTQIDHQNSQAAAKGFMAAPFDPRAIPK